MTIEIELKDGRVFKVEKNMCSLLHNIKNGDLVMIHPNLYVDGSYIKRVEVVSEDKKDESLSENNEDNSSSKEEKDDSLAKINETKKTDCKCENCVSCLGGYWCGILAKQVSRGDRCNHFYKG